MNSGQRTRGSPPLPEAPWRCRGCLLLVLPNVEISRLKDKNQLLYGIRLLYRVTQKPGCVQGKRKADSVKLNLKYIRGTEYLWEP